MSKITETRLVGIGKMVLGIVLFRVALVYEAQEYSPLAVVALCLIGFFLVAYSLDEIFDPEGVEARETIAKWRSEEEEG